ncbi:hypothetical protein AAY473_040019 [Plecturocebus cupreus]
MGFSFLLHHWAANFLNVYAVSLLKRNAFDWAQWLTPVIPAIWETKEGESPERTDGNALKPQVSFEILRDLPHQLLERQLPDK